MVTARAHLGPWSQKGRKDPLWRPRGRAQPHHHREVRGRASSLREKRFGCSDLSGRHPDASMRVWRQLGLPVSAALLRTLRPRDSRTASPPRAETETQRRGRCALGCDHPQREGSSRPPLNHAGSRQNSQRGRLLASAWRWAFLMLLSFFS